MIGKLTLMSAAVVAVSTMMFSGTPAPAQTATIYPWCAHYGGRYGGGAPSCGSSTYAQCMATVSGMQGYCALNPFYQGPPPAAARQGKRPPRGS